MGTNMFLDPRPTLANNDRAVMFGWSLVQSVLNVANKIMVTLDAMEVRRTTEETLSRLDDRALRDVGIDRYVIPHIAERVATDFRAEKSGIGRLAA